MLTITLEEHFVSPDVAAQGDQSSNFPPEIQDKLLDLSTQRLSAMDEGGVSRQIISHVPVDIPPKLCTQANDELASAISKHPTRFSGFAELPISYPEDAAKELERCVHELGFVGALIGNHTSNGDFYDSPRFWPMFEAAQRLDVPLYIHPAFQLPSWMEFYSGNYSEAVQSTLAHYGWGWHANTGSHVLRLFAAGVFDQYPRLKIIIGHMGEMLPFQLERTAGIMSGWVSQGEGTKKSLKEVWDTNIWITTSGMFSTNPFACVLRNTHVERIMYSVDYPFSTHEEGESFLKELKDSGLVSEEQLQMIAHKNAETLLGLEAGP